VLFVFFVDRLSIDWDADWTVHCDWLNQYITREFVSPKAYGLNFS